MQAFMNILQKNSFETNGSFEKSPVILLKQSPDELQLLATHPDFYFGSLSNGVDNLENFTSEMEWSFLFPSVSPVFFQIGTVKYKHRLRFRWRGFLPLIRKARTRCESTVNVTQR